MADLKKVPDTFSTVHSLSKEYSLSLRDIDKALMAFGQFLDRPKRFLY